MPAHCRRRAARRAALIALLRHALLHPEPGSDRSAPGLSPRTLRSSFARRSGSTESSEGCDMARRPMPAATARRHSSRASCACTLPHPPTAAGSLLAPTRMPAGADEPAAAVPCTARDCRPAQTTVGPGRSAASPHAVSPALAKQQERAASREPNARATGACVRESRKAPQSRPPSSSDLHHTPCDSPQRVASVVLSAPSR